jgi:hypothetical protein
MSRCTRIAAFALLTALLTTAWPIVGGTPSAAAAAGTATAAPPGPTALPTAAARPVPLAARDEAPLPVLEVVSQGFSAYPAQYTGNVTSWAVKLRNPNAATWHATGASLRVTFTDANGAVVLVEEGPVTADVGPGQITAFASTNTREATGLATAMQVEVLDTNWTDGRYRAVGEITMGPATARPATGPGTDISPQVLVDCSASSTFLSKLSSFFVTVVYLDAQGRIIGGSSHNSDIDGAILSVPGGGRAEFTLKGYFVPPSGVPAVECHANFVRPV